MAVDGTPRAPQQQIMVARLGTLYRSSPLPSRALDFTSQAHVAMAQLDQRLAQLERLGHEHTRKPNSQSHPQCKLCSTKSRTYLSRCSTSIYCLTSSRSMCPHSCRNTAPRLHQSVFTAQHTAEAADEFATQTQHALTSLAQQQEALLAAHAHNQQELARLTAIVTTAQKQKPQPPAQYAAPMVDDNEFYDAHEQPVESHHFNPSLPHYTGAEDPGLWLLKVQAEFEAHRTPTAQQGVWMVCALRGAAMSFWFLECKELSKQQEIIAH